MVLELEIIHEGNLLPGAFEGPILPKQHGQFFPSNSRTLRMF